ncbi:hypothetical protein AR457_38030 [Streptomyces agglomeratus]|uniref:hypothetical protein n=1 Tax=Streptomyces agglomeratus TaxID=285458 RepID=UPI0008526DA9|nr:hypothetical protein [Streptomyces agglomeratus]OEJ23003.1 hypothetical protein AR457_38030 [Streptomyces agglomeratus]OEJ36860.1 hypothetical protein BGK70_00325 [Streptomyces agglomeratus]
MLAKSVMFRVRHLAAIITTVRKAMTNRFGRSTPSAPQPLHHELHRAARFRPVEAAGFDGEDTLPALEMGGVLVFVYLDSDSTELRVSVDLDTVDQRLVRHDDPDETVPMHITFQGDTVFRA